MMFFLIIMHTIGGHFTFERVPFDFITDLFGFSRNHYDRVAHFTVGFYAYPLAELLLKKRLVSSRWVLFLFPLFTIVAVVGIYEIFEWLYAVSADESRSFTALASRTTARKLPSFSSRIALSRAFRNSAFAKYSEASMRRMISPSIDWASGKSVVFLKMSVSGRRPRIAECGLVFRVMKSSIDATIPSEIP